MNKPAEIFVKKYQAPQLFWCRWLLPLFIALLLLSFSMSWLMQSQTGRLPSHGGLTRNAYAQPEPQQISSPGQSFSTYFPADRLSRCLNMELVIAIDVGHTPKASGVKSARGISEYQFNLRLAKRLLKRLHKQGFHQAFLLTADDPGMGLLERAFQAKRQHADLLLSIHHDSAQLQYFSQWQYRGRTLPYSDHFKGHSLFFSGKNAKAEQSLHFARLLGDELLSLELSPTLHHAEAIKGENRPLVDREKGIYQFDNLILLKNAEMPAVLLEAGVIVNREEEMKLNQPQYQYLLIAAVERALLRFAHVPCQ